MHYMSGKQVIKAAARPASSEASLEIARRIRSARARAGVTRKQLAVASGVSERYLAHLEAGTGNPSVEMLMALGDSLGIAIADLLPMGGERDRDVSQAAQLLRRLSPERVRETLAWLGERPEELGGKALRIALVGLRGAGKTSLGKELAARLNVPFFEISKEVEQRYGGSVALLLEINGPGVLHRYEGEVLDDICKRHPAAVIAAPGAIVSDGKLYDRLLSSAWTVWLQARPEDHMERVVSQGDLRPMSGNRAAMDDLKNILAAREADYARADARLDTSAQGFQKTLDLLDKLTANLRNNEI